MVYVLSNAIVGVEWYLHSPIGIARLLWIASSSVMWFQSGLFPRRRPLLLFLQPQPASIFLYIWCSFWIKFLLLFDFLSLQYLNRWFRSYIPTPTSWLHSSTATDVLCSCMIDDLNFRSARFTFWQPLTLQSYLRSHIVHAPVRRAL